MDAKGRVRLRFTVTAGAPTFNAFYPIHAFAESAASGVAPGGDLPGRAGPAGPWSARARRVCAGPGNVMQDAQAFRLKANGHYLATSYVGMDFAGGVSMVQGVDAPADHLAVDPGAGSRSLHTPLNQIVSFIPTSGVPRLAGRFVFDLWSGRYGESAEALRRSFRYGLTGAVVIWRRWQRWGYDYRLPDIYPPNPESGTVEEFLNLAGTCKKNGALFAPHDNYMDFYPDSEGFTYDNIAFTAERKLQTAWLRLDRPRLRVCRRRRLQVCSPFIRFRGPAQEKLLAQVTFRMFPSL